MNRKINEPNDKCLPRFAHLDNMKINRNEHNFDFYCTHNFIIIGIHTFISSRWSFFWMSEWVSTEFVVIYCISAQSFVSHCVLFFWPSFLIATYSILPAFVSPLKVKRFRFSYMVLLLQNFNWQVWKAFNFGAVNKMSICKSFINFC